MGSGEKSVRNFHIHLPHLHHHHHQQQQQQQQQQGKKQEIRDVPKGCLAIKVGQGEEQQRFVVPVIYFNHPLFMQLLKEAEEEYGFDQKGTITIPCHVEEFSLRRRGEEYGGIVSGRVHDLHVRQAFR